MLHVCYILIIILKAQEHSKGGSLQDSLRESRLEATIYHTGSAVIGNERYHLTQFSFLYRLRYSEISREHISHPNKILCGKLTKTKEKNKFSFK